MNYVHFKQIQDQADALCNFPKHTFKAIENGTAFLAKLKMP
jgi:hypothetical protein